MIIVEGGSTQTVNEVVDLDITSVQFVLFLLKDLQSALSVNNASIERTALDMQGDTPTDLLLKN